MKKSIIYYVLSLMLVSFAAQTQSLGNFKVDLLLGLSRTSNSFGALASIESKYLFTQQLALGMKLEAADAYPAKLIEGQRVQTGPINGVNSIMLTSEYFLKKTGVKPFLGIGYGIYDAIFTAKPGRFQDRYSMMGTAPRLGVETNHLRIVLEHNMLETSPKQNNYTSIKAGFTFGGARK